MESRRSFIKTSGITAIGAVLLSDPFLKSCSQLSDKTIEEIAGQFSHTCEIIRPDDFLYLRYYFVNLKLKRNKLFKINEDADSFIIVRLPQQHIAEEVHKSKNPIDPKEDWSFNNNCEIKFPDDKVANFSKSFISGFSYLTFTLKKNQLSFDYNQESLNNWNQFDLLTIEDLKDYPKDIPASLLIGKNEYPLNENNFPLQLAIAKIQELIIPLTIIEAPYKLFLSPVAPCLRPEKETDYRYQFQKNNSVATYYLSEDGKYKLTELWSNDLVFQISHPLKGIIKIPPNFKIVAFEENSDINDSDKDVFLLPYSSNESLPPPYNDLPTNERLKLSFLTNIQEDKRDVYSDYFNLSSFGLTTKLHYKNLDSQKFGIVGWDEEIKLGREINGDIIVKAIDARSGLKLLVTFIKERVIEKGKAPLIYRQRFDYLESYKEFTDPLLFNGHLIKKIYALSKGSYYIPETIQDGKVAIDECSKALIQMPYTCIDSNGNEIHLDIDVFIILEDTFRNPQVVKNTLIAFNQKIVEYYASPRTYLNDHSVKVKNIKIGFAPTINKQSENDAIEQKNTELTTTELQFHSIYGGEYNSEYPVLPRLKFAHVFIPQLEEIDSVPSAKFVNYCESYIKVGFLEQNKSKVFFQTLVDDFNKTFVVSKETDDQIINDLKLSALKPIKNIFSDNYKNAGPPINPDIVIDNLSALHQSLSFTDELNNRVNDVKNIRPADLLRGMNVEILGGIDLRKILKNIIPVEDSPVFNIIEDASEGFAAIQDYKQEYENLKSQINNIPGEIASLEAQLKDAFNDAVKTYLDKYFETKNKIKQLKDQIETDVISGKKKIYEVLREQQKNLEENVKDEISKLIGQNPLPTQLNPLKDIVEAIQKFFENATVINSLITVIALKQIIDTIQYASDQINSGRLMSADPMVSAKVSENASLINLINQLKIITQEQSLVNNATTIIKQKISELFATPVKNFINNYPNVASQLIKELFKLYLFKISLDDISFDVSITVSGQQVNLISYIKQYLDENKLMVPDLISNRDDGTIYFKLQDNIDAIIEILNQNAVELQNISIEYHKIFTDACNDVVFNSKKFIQLEIQKLNKSKDYLYTQINYEVSKEIDAIKESIESTELYNSVKDDYFFFQTAYLEFLDIENRAKQIESMLSIDLSTFKKSYAILIPNLRASIKDNLNKKLQTAATDPKLSNIKTNLDNIISSTNSIVFENVNDYVNAFGDAETAIVNQATSLYLRVDAEKQKIITEINGKKKQLNDLKIQLRDFLKNKIQEKENELIESNKELIDAYKKGDHAVKEAQNKIQEFKTQLDKLKAINKKEIRYSWKTNKFDDTNLGILKFITGKQQPTELSVDVINTINFDITSFPPHVKGISNEIKSRLSNFSINFLSILSVEFDNVSFVGGSEIKEKFDVSIRDVRFDGPLNFVQVFQSFLKSIDKGLRFDISLGGAVLGYEACLPDITGGAFNFVNWKLVMELRLPFKAGVPMRLNFGLNTPQDMGLVSGAIWGGRGCLVIGLEPKRGIVSILLVIEVGVVVFLNIGVAEGIVYIFAGIYIKKEYDKVEIRGYLTCGGALNILGLITASVTFYLGLIGNGNYLEGYCTISYEIKIAAFIKISVGMSMYKRIYGCPDNSQSTSHSTPQQMRSGMTIKQFNRNTTTTKLENMDIGSNTINFTNAEIDEYLEANFN